MRQNQEANSLDQEIHEILTTKFTDRYISRNHLGLVAHSLPYDPDNPICDYSKTNWEAQPNALSEQLGRLVVCQTNRVKSRDLNRVFIPKFIERSKELTEALEEFPVMQINGHHPDLQASIPLLCSSIALAHTSEHGSYKQRLYDMFKSSYVLATRGIAPVMIGRPHFPIASFTRVAQLATNPFFSFPATRSIFESGLPRAFVETYNSRLKSSVISATHQPPKHPDGLHSVWGLSPSGTKDEKLTSGEHAGKIIMPVVKDGTKHMIRDTNCGVVAMYTRFTKKGAPMFEIGKIIPPNEITDDTLPTIMADLAAFRRMHGQLNTYYEEELITTA